MRSSTVDDSEDVRTSRVGLEAAQDIEDMVLNTGQTVPHSVSQSQPVFDYRSWPRLDVTMATRIQPSCTVDLGNYNNLWLRLAETRRNCVPGPHEMVSERSCTSD